MRVAPLAVEVLKPLGQSLCIGMFALRRAARHWPAVDDVNVPTQNGATTGLSNSKTLFGCCGWIKTPWLPMLTLPGGMRRVRAFSGGYSIHHALGNDKQFVGWFGQPLRTIHSCGNPSMSVYDSNCLGVVNEFGSNRCGRLPGSALMDSNNRAVGSATFAQLVNGQNTAGVCPASTPSAPTPDTVTALFTSLAAIWDSTADTTSTTGTATLQSALDTAGDRQACARWHGPTAGHAHSDQSY